MSAVAGEAESFQLNPLALASETTGRFRMLLAAAFTMTWGLAEIWIPTNPFFSVSSLREGESIVKVEGTTLRSEDLDFGKFIRAVLSSPEAQAEIWRQLLQLLVSVGLVVTFLMLTLMLFRSMPARALRNQSARRLDAVASPRLAAELDRLAGTAGFKDPPRWYTKPGYLDGHASGLSARAALVIAGDPRRLRYGLNDPYRAVVLHELGHLKNRDTETREGASAAWQTLALLAALTPVALWLADTSWLALRQLSLRLTASAVIGLAIWAGLVRSREYFADWRVVLWGYDAALKSRLGLPEASRSTGGSGESSRFGWLALLRKGRSLFNFHPSNRARLRMLAEPIRLFRVSPLLASLTGLLLALTAGHLGISCFQLIVVSMTPVMAVFLAAGGLPGIVLVLGLAALGSVLLLPLTYWVVGALGTQVLRAAVGDMAEGSSANWGYRRLAFVAASFVVGVEVGLWLTPMGVTGWSAPIWMMGWLTILTLLVWFWLIQTRALGRLVLNAWAESSKPGKVEGRLRLLMTFLLIPIFWPAMVGRATIGAAAELSRSGVETILGDSVETFVPFLLTTSFGLLTAALIANSLLGLTIFAVIGWRVRRRRPACGRCGECWQPGRTVGLRCPGCGEPAAAWLYFRPLAMATSQAALAVGQGRVSR